MGDQFARIVQAPREPLSSEVARALLDAVFSGQITPGTRMPSERQLAESFGVGRFVVRDSAGAQKTFQSESFSLQPGVLTDVGGYVWGNSGAPNALANVYGGAFHMWTNSLKASNRMIQQFTNVAIWAFDNACPTSCANGALNRITLDPAAAYQPQGRIMHEMGHLTSYRASRDQSFNQPGKCEFYSFPSTSCGVNSWSLGSAEWEAAAFEEAVATHLGDISLYRATATQPHTCLSASACATSSYNVETSLGTSCAANQNRAPLNHVRYLWDNYDANADYAGETLNRPMYDVIDTLYSFENGYDNRQKNEAFGVGNVIDDLDGRSPVDYREKLLAAGVSSATQLSNNCGSQGD